MSHIDLCDVRPRNGDHRNQLTPIRLESDAVEIQGDVTEGFWVSLSTNRSGRCSANEELSVKRPSRNKPSVDAPLKKSLQSHHYHCSDDDAGDLDGMCNAIAWGPKYRVDP
jgi:hypothetical protein